MIYNQNDKVQIVKGFFSGRIGVVITSGENPFVSIPDYKTYAFMQDEIKLYEPAIALESIETGSDNQITSTYESFSLLRPQPIEK